MLSRIPRAVRGDRWASQWSAAQLSKIAPGIAASAAVTAMSSGLLLPMIPAAVPVSPASLALVTGLALSPLAASAPVLKPGLGFASGTMLRSAIVLLASRMSFSDLLSLGAWGVPAVLSSVTVGIVATRAISAKLGLSQKLGLLLSAGSSICGVSAVSALSPAIKASATETAVAVGSVTAFGLVAVMTYPHFAHSLFADAKTAGMFLGLAVHDTSQVIASALSYEQIFGETGALKVATITKLTRNLCLAAVIPLLASIQVRSEGLTPKTIAPTGAFSRITGIVKSIPTFVIVFMGVSAIRTLGDYALTGSPSLSSWTQGMNSLGTLSTNYLVPLAMCSVGLSTNLAALRSVGLKPFIAGFGGALSVGASALAISLVVGPNL